jgi:copper chaperone CopZ
MRNFILFTLLLAGLTASAQEAKKNKNAKYDIEVKGVCDQCKRRIEKAAFSVAGVKSAEYHLDDQTLHVILNEEKTSAVAVREAVAKAGHDTDEIKASDADYNSLHHCCKYERQ